MRPGYFVIIFFVLLAGCRGSRFAANNLVPGSIPSDITSPKYVLLVQLDEHGNPNMLDKVMKKYYPAAYEIIKEGQDKSDEKYANVDKYRYLVAIRYGSGGTVKTTYAPGAPHTGPSQVVYSDQTVFDRKENKGLPATNLMGHNFAQGMMLFSEAITKK